MRSESSSSESKTLFLTMEPANAGCSDEEPLRRSPRFSPSQRHSVKRQRSSGPELQLICSADLKEKKSVPNGECFQEMSRRRSPRLASNHSECERICRSKSAHKIATHSNTKFDVRHLRQSPRINLYNASKECVEQLNVKSYGGTKLRRSPRLSASSENGNLEVNIIQEKRASKLFHQKKQSKMISTSIELYHSPIEQHSEVQTISRNSSPRVENKCLILSITPQSCMEENGTVSPDFDFTGSDDKPPRKKNKTIKMDQKRIPSFIGDPIPDDEAQRRWGWRYELKEKKCKDKKFKINEDEEDEIIVNVKSHYAQVEIGNCIFSLGDCAFIKGEGEVKHVGQIVEFFQTTDSQNYFRVRWFYRIQDTVVQDEGGFHDKRRLFYSSIMNDNLIDCIIAKVNVTHLRSRVGLKLASISPSDFYYDMGYSVDYSTFHSIPTDNPVENNELTHDTVHETLSLEASKNTNSLPSSESDKTELALLDLYSGCGGMSTGLCYGAKVSSVNLVTRWAVDSDRSASESLKLNHPDTHVRNESAEDFLELLKEWEKLCKRYKVSDAERKFPLRKRKSLEVGKEQVNSQSHDDIPDDDELEVSRFVDICYGDPNETRKRGVYLKVHWKGYSSSEDTWEPIENLSKCKDAMHDFVREGVKSKILPHPGDVDVICGGPPCQGISGYNRFRNTVSPLDDERNRQIVVFMDIVKYLKPKYVLMENVVDILKFDKGSLGRYALSRLVHMNYQARLGIVAAGCYGLPQFRLRVFLWGAHPSEILPQFPLPTHDVVVKYWPPMEFERNVVAYDEDQPRDLEKAAFIQDAISDLPAVANSETRDEMSYQNNPETELQRYIRSTKYEMTGLALNGTTEERSLLYDHRPYFLFEDDYQRVCQIPKRKGANFRDLPGVVVGADNVARRQSTEKLLLPSGKPLVPDYVFTFEQGKSKRPFARLWWDETVPTALTFPSCHNQVILHPEQDRILTVREFARLQGFPDYYRFYGTVKERYCQIGNAVCVSVSRALGYALGMAYRKVSGNEPLMKLPPKFSHSNYLQLSSSSYTESNPSVDPAHSENFIAPSDYQLGPNPSAEDPTHSGNFIAPSNNQFGSNPSTEDRTHSESFIASSDNKLQSNPSVEDLTRSGSFIAPSDNKLQSHPFVEDPAHSGNFIAPSGYQLGSIPSEEDLRYRESFIAPSDHQLGSNPSEEDLRHSRSFTTPSDHQLGSHPSVEDPTHTWSFIAPSGYQLGSNLSEEDLRHRESFIAPFDHQLGSIPSEEDLGHRESFIAPSDHRLGSNPSEEDLGHSESFTAPSNHQLGSNPSEEDLGHSESFTAPSDHQLGSNPSEEDRRPSESFTAPSNHQLGSNPSEEDLGHSESFIAPSYHQLGSNPSVEDPAHVAPSDSILFR
ncbi:PREDICTED: DNA (cytosine-5)-methyltransferase 1-like isoform X2 [Lupinus angustifolius]|uniref:DNA (cytosine-5)-methyltransferase 1-like isoform X2 n=1 Tax=Lupinus angustifolius TaxID=3871 RepID=UPI00092ECBE6|nr:PREDICTED: DNA (cytosine-5)-methyltransferase 1-like isoform X2 [Lupinus angustifolius]